MLRRFAPLLIALGAALAWWGSTMVWVRAEVIDDMSGPATKEISGSGWALELMALLIVLVAGAGATLALRRRGRQVVGAIVALAAAGAAFRPVVLLSAGADPQVAQRLLQAAAHDSTAVGVDSIASWAAVSTTETLVLGPLLVLLGAALAFIAGVIVVMRPGQDRVSSTKYASVAQRRQRLGEELDQDPDSGRVMWDALDSDIDPTDLPR